MHVEYNVSNPNEVVEFFQKMFGWEFPVHNDSQWYGVNQGIVIGVVSFTDSKFFPGTTSFLTVPSLHEYVSKAEQLGAKVILPEEILPDGMGKVAILILPGGLIPIGLWERT